MIFPARIASGLPPSGAGKTVLATRRRALPGAIRAAWAAAVCAAALIAPACAPMNFQVKDYPGEVRLTPPPAEISRERLVAFKVICGSLYSFETIPWSDASLDQALESVNPHHYPVYSLRVTPGPQWWDLGILAVSKAFLYGSVDTRSAEVRGLIALPRRLAKFEERDPVVGVAVSEDRREVEALLEEKPDWEEPGD